MSNTVSPTPAPTGNRVAGWLTPSEFAILEVICDTLLPSLEPPAGSTDVVVASYRRSARGMHIAQIIAEILAGESSDVHANLRRFFALFTAPAMSLLLTGKARSLSRFMMERGQPGASSSIFCTRPTCPSTRRTLIPCG